jgi:hypothetical protein
MDTDTKLKRYLDDTLDRCFVYSIMLHRAERFYNRMKMLFKMPIILTSSAMSIVNSNFEGDQMKSVNIVFNILTGVILAVGTAWQFEAKEQEFSNAKKKFVKLSCEIEGKQLSNEKIDPAYVTSVIERYNNIEENLDYDIPQFILKSTREMYKGEKTLPIIINGVKKDEIHRPETISFNNSPLACIPENRVLQLEKRITDL